MLASLRALSGSTCRTTSVGGGPTDNQLGLGLDFNSKDARTYRGSNPPGGGVVGVAGTSTVPPPPAPPGDAPQPIGDLTSRPLLSLPT